MAPCRCASVGRIMATGTPEAGAPALQRNLAGEPLLAVTLGVFTNALGYTVSLPTLAVIVIGVSLLAGLLPIPVGIGVTELRSPLGWCTSGCPRNRCSRWPFSTASPRSTCRRCGGSSPYVGWSGTAPFDASPRQPPPPTSRFGLPNASVLMRLGDQNARVFSRSSRSGCTHRGCPRHGTSDSSGGRLQRRGGDRIRRFAGRPPFAA